MSYIRSRAHQLGLPRDFYRNLDVHLHIPEGAIPKDGPSAGITIATTICSALTKIPVRGDIAMTGEITLRGKVLPIGGLKEKLLAAHRHGINEVIVPKDNQKDLPDIPEYIRNLMKLHFVDHMDEVLRSRWNANWWLCRWRRPVSKSAHSPKPNARIRAVSVLSRAAIHGCSRFSVDSPTGKVGGRQDCPPRENAAHIQSARSLVTHNDDSC